MSAVAARRAALLCGGLALAMTRPALASGSLITDAMVMALMVVLAIWLCMLATTLVVAVRRWRRRGRRGLWYLLVPLEATVIAGIGISLIGGLPGDHPLVGNAMATMGGAMLIAWLIAHLLHSGQRLDAQPGASSGTAG